MQRTGKPWIIIVSLAAATALSACESDNRGGASPPPMSGSQPMAAPVGVLEWSLIRGEATVKSLDPARRLAVLRNAEGKTLTLKVGPNVDLAKVRVGDTVAMAFYEAVAITLGPAGTAAPGVSGVTTVVPAVQGQVPAGLVLEQVTITVEITALDSLDHTITFMGPEGNERTVAVKSPEMQQRMNALQVGDLVQVTYTEGLAMQVVPKTT